MVDSITQMSAEHHLNTCYFCEQLGHCTHKCQAFKQAKVNAKANHGRFRHSKKANKASEATASSSTPSAPSGSSTTPLQLPQHQGMPRTQPRMPRVSQSLLEMQVFVLLTLPTLFALYNLMHMLTGMQTQVPHLI